MEDALPIMRWRNAQMDALRKKNRFLKMNSFLILKSLIEQVFPSPSPDQILRAFHPQKQTDWIWRACSY